MPEKVRELKPPRGLSKLFFRSPILLYRLGLGWLMGNRLLLLNHIGRISGLQRQVVLEVAHHDQAADTFIINAGFGEQSDWYRNLKANPDVSIVVGKRFIEVRAEPLPAGMGGEVMVTFAKEHPLEARMSSLTGYRVDGTDQDWHALGEQMLFVQLRPR
jgi:deazaflavin-dependent oxidoreductase (nitroreductase family)